mgnify:CR=1 FL=1
MTICFHYKIYIVWVFITLKIRLYYFVDCLNGGYENSSMVKLKNRGRLRWTYKGNLGCQYDHLIEHPQGQTVPCLGLPVRLIRRTFNRGRNFKKREDWGGLAKETLDVKTSLNTPKDRLYYVGIAS